jgi:hypothetical protein
MNRAIGTGDGRATVAMGAPVRQRQAYKSRKMAP